MKSLPDALSELRGRCRRTSFILAYFTTSWAIKNGSYDINPALPPCTKIARVLYASAKLQFSCNALYLGRHESSQAVGISLKIQPWLSGHAGCPDKSVLSSARMDAHFIGGKVHDWIHFGFVPLTNFCYVVFMGSNRSRMIDMTPGHNFQWLFCIIECVIRTLHSIQTCLFDEVILAIKVWIKTCVHLRTFVYCCYWHVFRMGKGKTSNGHSGNMDSQHLACPLKGHVLISPRRHEWYNNLRTNNTSGPKETSWHFSRRCV